jgi:hypothetical protein
MARTVGKLTASAVPRLEKAVPRLEKSACTRMAAGCICKYKDRCALLAVPLQAGRPRALHGTWSASCRITCRGAPETTEASSQRVNGVDPIQARNATRQAAKAAGTSFKTCAESTSHAIRHAGPASVTSNVEANQAFPVMVDRRQLAAVPAICIHQQWCLPSSFRGWSACVWCPDRRSPCDRGPARADIPRSVRP